MKSYLILSLTFLLMTTTVSAQKDPVKRTITTTKKITVEQEQWLRKNYQHITGMKKDSARMEIRKNFSSISNTSLDYMISRAGKLLQEDKQKHLAMVQQMLRSLTAQKNALTKQIAEKEKELKKIKDAASTQSLQNEIIEMKNKVKDLDKEIKYLHDSK